MLSILITGGFYLALLFGGVWYVNRSAIAEVRQAQRTSPVLTSRPSRRVLADDAS